MEKPQQSPRPDDLTELPCGRNFNIRWQVTYLAVTY